MQKIARLDYVYQSCGFIMEGQLQQIALALDQNGLEAALECQDLTPLRTTLLPKPECV
jgi:hypothetical protein